MSRKSRTSGALEVHLRELLAAWRENTKRIGDVLNRLLEAGEPVDIIIREVCVRQFGMAAATARTAMRWAAGDFGDDVTARHLVTVVPHSILEAMPKQTVATITQGKHRIYSPAAGRVVSKAFREWDRQDASANLTAKGIKPLSAQVQKLPEYRSCIAQAVTRNERGNVVFIAYGREPVHMMVPQSLLEQALALDDEPVAAAL